MQFRMIRLVGMIMDLGWFNLLSGQIQRYRVEFGSATWHTPTNPLGCGTGLLGHAGRTRAVSPAGPHRGFGPNAGF
jgi:hypothetical protein